jgi:hypothetical protein
MNEIERFVSNFSYNKFEFKFNLHAVFQNQNLKTYLYKREQRVQLLFKRYK